MEHYFSLLSLVLGAALAGAAAVLAFMARRAPAAGAGESLAKSEARFRALAENSSEALLLLGADRRVIFASQSMLRVTGYSPEERLGSLSGVIVHADDKHIGAAAYEQALARPGQAAHFRVRMTHKAGHLIHAEGSFRNYFDDPHIGAMVLNYRDVTAEHEAREALAKNEARFRALAEDSSEVLVLMQADGRVAYASPSVERVTGYTPEERVGSHSSGVLHPEDQPHVWAVFKQAVEDPSRTYAFESRLLHKKGHYIHTSAKLRNFLADPAVGALALNYRDITEEYQAREALAKTDARFRALIETSAEATLLMDAQFRILNYYGAVESILGYKAEERIGRDTESRVHRDDIHIFKGLIAHAMADPGSHHRGEYRAQGKDGSWQWLDATFVNRLDDPTIGAIVVTHHNITVRKEAEEARRQSQDYYRALIENSLAIVLIYRLNGSVSYENPGVVKDILGYEATELHALGTFDLVHPEDLASVLKQAENAKLQAQDKGQMQVRLKAKNGTWLSFDSRSVNLSHNPVVGGVLVQLRDITGSLEAQRQLLRFERLAAIGQTSAGLAHEIRNPLAIISARAEFLKMQLEGQAVQDLDSILRQCERLNHLVGEVLERANIADLDLAEVQAADLLKRSLKAAQTRFGPASARVTATLDLAGSLPPLTVDAAQMERVLTNLILNAFQATPAGGALTLGARLEGGKLRLEVGDNGSGIPAAKLAKIFEPFFTTKSTGSGLGLWICKSIVEQHGGQIMAENLKPSGCLFVVTLPLKAQDTA